MNLRTICRYASSRTMHRLLIYFFTIILCFMMFLLLLASWFSWRYVRYERYVCDQCLNGGIKHCGMFMIESENGFDKDFWEDISKVDGIAGFSSGDVYDYPVDGIEKFGNQQKKLNPEYVKKTGYVPWFVMNTSGVNVCNFNLQEGKFPEEWQLQENEELIYLGGNFENVTVGEKIESQSEEITYVVGGILKKGSNWIYDDVYRFESIQDSHYVQCLDNMVVEMSPVLMSGRLTYCVNKGYKIEDVESKLLDVAEKNGVVIKLARLEDVLDENEYQFSIILNVIRLLTMIIILTSIFVLERTQYSEVVNDTEYFGIFYANGASSRDLTAILVGENLLKLALSFVLAVLIGYYILRFEWQMFQPDIEQWNTAKSVYFGQAVAPSFLMGVGMVSLCTIKSIRWLKKKKPMELLKDYKV